jgi:hypothetical protein
MIEILVVRDPDSADEITVWGNGFDITRECTVITVDAGAGWDYDDWRENAEAALATLSSDAACIAVDKAYADPPGREYIEDWPDEEEPA